MSTFIAAACRSPVVPRDGALSQLSLHALGSPVLLAALQRAGLDKDEVDEVIVSNALGAGGNPARHLALASGLPDHVAGLSTDRQCAGGMDAILLARQMILAGEADVVLAGGVESYSRRPLRARTFPDGRPPQPYDQAPFTPWPDRDPEMAAAADVLAQTYGITRAAQDDWAVTSHAKALSCKPSPDEMVSFDEVTKDSFTRQLTPALCARARVLTGTITAANTAVAADAAALCVVVSEKVMRRLATPCVEILSGATRGADPEQPGIAPLAAISRALKHADLSAEDIDICEVMEAYAVQAIACVQGAGLDPATVNRGGGALARGHPIGASGAINVVRLYHELCKTPGTGLATIAAAGGIGSALILRA